MSTSLELYRKVLTLKSKLELDDEKGNTHSKEKITASIQAINSIFEVLERRKGITRGVYKRRQTGV